MSERGSGLGSWKRPILFVLATLPIGFFVISFLFMWRYEAAFDESSCPFTEGELREVADGVRVREEFRTCQPGVEEHRWVLMREGREPYPIALRALSEEEWRGYSWTAAEEEQRVVIRIQNPGRDPRVFREAAPDGGVR